MQRYMISGLWRSHVTDIVCEGVYVCVHVHSSMCVFCVVFVCVFAHICRCLDFAIYGCACPFRFLFVC